MLISGFNQVNGELEKYWEQDNFAEFFANLDFDEGLFGTPGTSYETSRNLNINNIPMENYVQKESRVENLRSLENMPTRTQKIINYSMPTQNLLSSTTNEFKKPLEVPAKRRKRNLIPYSERPVVGYPSRPRKVRTI